MPTSLGTYLAVLDVLRTRRAGPELIASRQQQRLNGLIEYARWRSPFYRQLYARFPNGVPDLVAAPVVTKQQLMARFDGVVTDRAVTRREVDAFPASPGNLGKPFLGHYQVATSSGGTGHPGVFLLDERARVLSTAILKIRGRLNNWFGLRETLRFAASRRRFALVQSPPARSPTLSWLPTSRTG